MARKILYLLLILCMGPAVLVSCNDKGKGADTKDRPQADGGDSSAISPQGPQIWMHTIHPWVMSTDERVADYFDFLSDTSKWQYVSENLDVLSMFGYIMLESDGWTDGRVAAFCDMIKETGLKINLEVAYSPQKGAYDRFTERGVYVDYLDFDGLIYNKIFSGAKDSPSRPAPAMSLDEAVEETVKVMLEWQELFPDVEIYYAFNFPNNGWKGYKSMTQPGLGVGDAYEALIKLNSAAHEAGVNLVGITADSPYDCIVSVEEGGDSIDRLLDLENEVRNLGLKFNLIFNDSSSGEGGPAGQYYKDTLQYIKEYEQRGGKPDVYTVESWYSINPPKHIPEDEPYTLSYIAAQVIGHVKEGKPIDMSGLDFAFRPTEELSVVMNWSFAEDSAGWAKQNDISEFYVQDGALVVTSRGNDPYFGSKNNLKLEATQCDYIHLRLKNHTEAAWGQIFFAHDGAAMSAETDFTYKMEPARTNGGWQDIYVPVKENELWNGTINQLRVDPTNAPGTVEFELIEILAIK